jgi:hypothetical protein
LIRNGCLTRTEQRPRDALGVKVAVSSFGCDHYRYPITHNAT